MMTSSIDEPDRRRSRLALWLGHNAHIITYPVPLLLLLGAIFRKSFPWVWWVATASMVLAALSLLLQARHHDRRLCEQCLSETPFLDPEGAVHKHRRALHSYHQETLWTLGFLLYVGIMSFISVHWWTRLTDLLFNAAFCCWLYIGRVHRQLEVWCPYCDDDDDDDDDEDDGDDEPDPSDPLKLAPPKESRSTL